jgi:hypothetical protein
MARASLKVSFTLGPPWLLKAYQRLSAVFQAQFEIAHRKSAMVIAAHVVRYSRVDTGRFWNAWTPFLDAAGYNYQRYAPVSEGGDSTAAAEGKALGSFLDQPFRTVLGNGVKYALELEQRTGIFREGYGSLQGAVPMFDRYFARTFDKAAALVAKAVEEGKPQDLDPGAPDL